MDRPAPPQGPAVRKTGHRPGGDPRWWPCPARRFKKLAESLVPATRPAGPRCSSMRQQRLPLYWIATNAVLTVRLRSARSGRPPVGPRAERGGREYATGPPTEFIDRSGSPGRPASQRRVRWSRMVLTHRDPLCRKAPAGTRPGRPLARPPSPLGQSGLRTPRSQRPWVFFVVKVCSSSVRKHNSKIAHNEQRIILRHSEYVDRQDRTSIIAGQVRQRQPGRNLSGRVCWDEHWLFFPGVGQKQKEERMIRPFDNV